MILIIGWMRLKFTRFIKKMTKLLLLTAHLLPMLGIRKKMIKDREIERMTETRTLKMDLKSSNLVAFSLKVIVFVFIKEKKHIEG